MDLQQSLDRFKADLQAYIQAEVSRQLAAQMRTVASGASRLAQPSTAATSPQSSQESIQASLDELAALAQGTPRATSDFTVDRLVNEYGTTSTTSNTAATMPSASNANYLNELAQLGQAPKRIVDTSAYDALTSMSSGASNGMAAVQPPQPVAASVTDTSTIDGAGQLSGIQSFLQKIRQRKNLSSN